MSWRLIERMQPGLFAQLVVAPLFSKHRILSQVAGHNMAVIKILPPLVVTRRGRRLLRRRADRDDQAGAAHADARSTRFALTRRRDRLELGAELAEVGARADAVRRPLLGARDDALAHHLVVVADGRRRSRSRSAVPTSRRRRRTRGAPRRGSRTTRRRRSASARDRRSPPAVALRPAKTPKFTRTSSAGRACSLHAECDRRLVSSLSWLPSKLQRGNDQSGCAPGREHADCRGFRPDRRARADRRRS